MNVLIVSKRQYMHKDLINDRYGRFYELASGLSDLEHSVTGICLSYRLRKEKTPSTAHSVETHPNWYSINLTIFPPIGLSRYLREIERLLYCQFPDVIFACSDAFQVIIAAHVSAKYEIPLVVDLYDNFESYRATKLPFAKKLFIKSLQKADGVCVISDRLGKYIRDNYNLKCPIKVLGNAISEKLFKLQDRRQCRIALGLPPNAKLIGTAGTLDNSRDIQTLYKAYDQIKVQVSDLHLVLAGPGYRPTQTDGNIHDFGLLDYSKVPLLFGALDVGVICNSESAFGRFCFPQKLYEILACGTPVVAASVGASQDILASHPYALYTPGSDSSLVSRLLHLLQNQIKPDIPIPSWSDRSMELEAFLLNNLVGCH